MYAHTRISLAYIDRSEVEFLELVYISLVQAINLSHVSDWLQPRISPVAARIPEYLGTHSPRSIPDPKQTIFAWANNRIGKNFYEVLAENPARLTQFNRGMMAQEAQQRIVSPYPFASLLKNIDMSHSNRHLSSA